MILFYLSSLNTSPISSRNILRGGNRTVNFPSAFAIGSTVLCVRDRCVIFARFRLLGVSYSSWVKLGGAIVARPFFFTLIYIRGLYRYLRSYVNVIYRVRDCYLYGYQFLKETMLRLAIVNGSTVSCLVLGLLEGVQSLFCRIICRLYPSRGISRGLSLIYVVVRQGD